MATVVMITILFVLEGVHRLEADIGNLTAISLSMDISARNRPDNMATVYVMNQWNLLVKSN
jgi:hypothetical protein